MNNPAASLDRYIRCFEQLAPGRLDELAGLFAEEARFKDPFNDVRGRAAIRAVFAHMFTQVQQPHFAVTVRALDGDVALLHWVFHFRLGNNRVARAIEGMSRVRFDQQGLVTEHVDYWDAAEQVYARLPVVGSLLRTLRRWFAATPP